MPPTLLLALPDFQTFLQPCRSLHRQIPQYCNRAKVLVKSDFDLKALKQPRILGPFFIYVL